jgi:hypothetical protein
LLQTATNNTLRKHATWTADFLDFPRQAFDDVPFNKGSLLNIAFKYVTENTQGWSCFVFHDLDFMPMNLNNLYTCGTKVSFHMMHHFSML